MRPRLSRAPRATYLSRPPLRQRLLIGLPYFFFRFFGLDMWGWAIGFIAFTAFVTFGFLAFCFFNCCGSVRVVQAIFRRRRDAMPFMDMVSNRFSLSSFNALLFLYPFCLLSTFVIGGSLLIEPSRSFANAGARTRPTPAPSPPPAPRRAPPLLVMLPSRHHR